jgi:MbtH protein
MTNPFEDDTASFYVLRNEEGQYSLWTATIAIPDGWSKQYGPETRGACSSFVEANWTDMRPNSLIERMNESA